MSADDEDTDPATPSAKNPTLTMISRQIAALSHQVVLLGEAQKTSAVEISDLRSSVPPAAPRPSLAAKAASKTASYTKVALAVLGALATIAQVLAADSQLKGPLLAIVEVLRTVLGGGP